MLHQSGVHFFESPGKMMFVFASTNAEYPIHGLPIWKVFLASLSGLLFRG